MYYTYYINFGTVVDIDSQTTGVRTLSKEDQLM
jgi:hypothetical protein